MAMYRTDIKDSSDSVANGIRGAGDRIGSGLAWLGFWIFLSSVVIDGKLGGIF